MQPTLKNTNQPMSENLLTVCGFSSVKAIAQHTPERIQRLFFDEASAPLFAQTCKYLAETHKIYRMVTTDELKRIAVTAHHQGVAAVITKTKPKKLDILNHHTLCLHNVENPHNVGAILRTAAFFGVERICVSRSTYVAAETAAAWRVAEGGLTHVKLWVYDNDEEFFTWAKEKNYRALAAVKPTAKTQRTLEEFLRDKKTSPLVVCLGNEEEGLPSLFVAQCHGHFSIRGSGRIESLNVSVTAALCLDRFS
ncbi:MAG TPA: RNA methyltransferase [Turneriella sp.]|nr:RNA methyltransferase [Turneriella sp.]